MTAELCGDVRLQTQLETEMQLEFVSPRCLGTIRTNGRAVYENSKCACCPSMMGCLKVNATWAYLLKMDCFGSLGVAVLSRCGGCFFCVLKERCKQVSRELGYAQKVRCPHCGYVSSPIKYVIKLGLIGDTVYRRFSCLRCERVFGEPQRFEGKEQQVQAYIRHRKSESPVSSMRQGR